MSSRALKKLERQREATRVGLSEEDVNESEDLVAHPQKAQNIFALIGAGDETEEETEEKEEEDKKLNIEEDNRVEVVNSSKSEKKKKKKKSKKLKKKIDESDDDAEIDRILKDLQQAEADTSTGNRTENDFKDSDIESDIEPAAHIDRFYQHFTPLKELKSALLLEIDPKDLDPDNEFKKLFGKLSQEALKDADSTTSTSIPPEQLQQIKRLSKLVRGWGGRDRRSIPGTTRKLILTKIRDDWIPTVRKDLTMEELTEEEIVGLTSINKDTKRRVEKLDRYGIKFYKLTRGAESKAANTQFFSSVVVMPNHENLLNLLPRYPYHVETILQVALILIRQGDKSNSNGLVERALFIFDRGFKQNFDLCNGLTRLPFQYYLNRQFYLTIFRYIDVLTKKGTMETAFSYTQLLLSLSPADDPYGVRYFIDFYALVAEKYEYLISFVKSFLVSSYEQWFTPNLAYSMVLAYLHLNDAQNAKKALKVAFVKHPFVGYKLIETIGLADDIPVHDYSVFQVGDEIELSTAAYLVRAPIIWNNSTHRGFLHDNLLELIKEKTRIEPVQESRDIPSNLIRFAILSGESKVMAKIPKHIWEENEIYEYDVLLAGDNVEERLEDFIDQRSITSQYNEEELMEMARNLSLQELIAQNE